MLESDKQAPNKQHHTAILIFERLRDEDVYAAKYTTMNDAVREWKQSYKEGFLPLAHPPGETQVDYGFAEVNVSGEATKVALFVMTLRAD